LELILAQDIFLNDVIYSFFDQAGFTREGVFNVHNNREVLGQIPATIRKRAQCCSGINSGSGYFEHLL
jgi:hypothetical protein